MAIVETEILTGHASLLSPKIAPKQCENSNH